MPHIVENRGRPSKICPEARQKILDAIGRNCPYQQAAHLGKIHESTLYRWLNQGEKDQKDGIITEYSLFREDLNEIEAKKVQDHLDVLNSCGPEKWQARAWVLERRWRSQFGADAAQLAEFLAGVKYLMEKDNGRANEAGNGDVQSSGSEKA